MTFLTGVKELLYYVASRSRGGICVASHASSFRPVALTLALCFASRNEKSVVVLVLVLGRGAGGAFNGGLIWACRVVVSGVRQAFIIPFLVFWCDMREVIVSRFGRRPYFSFLLAVGCYFYFYYDHDDGGRLLVFVFVLFSSFVLLLSNALSEKNTR